MDKPEECFEDVHIQPDAVVTKKIDLLFVTDTSGSIAEERKAIAEGIKAFVDELPLNTDLRVGVMAGHGSKGSGAGKLVKIKNEPHVLDLTQMKLEDLRYWLVEKLTKAPADSHSDGGEEGLYSLSRSLESGMLTANRAHGFYREDAALAVIFISDENDICARYPAGVKPVPDPEGMEVKAFARDCKDITPESTLAKLKALQGTRPLLVGGIIYLPGTKYPRSGENEVGYGYLETIRAADGAAIDLSGKKFDEGLSRIGSLASKKLMLMTDFALNKPAERIDESSLRVSIDGKMAPFEYKKDLNQIHLTGDAGMERSKVVIRYCLLAVKEECPPPTPSPTPTPPGDDGDDPVPPTPTPMPPTPTPTPVPPTPTPLPPGDVPDDPNL